MWLFNTFLLSIFKLIYKNISFIINPRQMTFSDSVAIISAAISIIVAIIIAIIQYKQSQLMQHLTARQDARDEKRRNEYVYSEATKFILKYSSAGRISEIYFLPLCVMAYKYNQIYPYRRRIYREFCSLTEEIQNEILKREHVNIICKKEKKFYQKLLNSLINMIESMYPEDKNIFYDDGKYFERALLNNGQREIPEITCKGDKYYSGLERIFRSIKKELPTQMNYANHITNLLCFEKNERPIETLFYEETNLGFPDSADEILISYLCCKIAEYVPTISHLKERSELYDSEGYEGKWYMEDLFLIALYNIYVNTI